MLTDRILDGIISAGAVILASDVADAFGQETPETCRDWDNVAKAKQWAHQMQQYREQQKRRRDHD